MKKKNGHIGTETQRLSVFKDLRAGTHRREREGRREEFQPRRHKDRENSFLIRGRGKRVGRNGRSWVAASQRFSLSVLHRRGCGHLRAGLSGFAVDRAGPVLQTGSLGRLVGTGLSAGVRGDEDGG